MRQGLLRGVALVAAASLIAPLSAPAQAPPPATAPPAAAAPALYNAEQLDALLAQIALYPDALLTQVLMASTYPLEIVEAWRWLQQDNNRALTGDALAQALEAQSWDPSVKSLVPFPMVLNLMNGNLGWTQQLGYAFANQQSDVWNSVQRLRAQAQAAGQLGSTPQQTVMQENGAIVIQPANPQLVYVPAYNPTVVYGPWPYPDYPPFWYPPPPDYLLGAAMVTGIAFFTGVIVVSSLWGWCGPVWYGGWGAWGGSVRVEPTRYNRINVHRPPLGPGGWHPPASGGAGGRPGGPPAGPAGVPRGPGPLPANAIGRPSVRVPGPLVSPRPPPGAPVGGAPGPRPGGFAPGAFPTPRPGGAGGAFGGLPQGGQASQFGQRGAQSRGFQPPSAGGAPHPPPSGGGGHDRNRRP
jgi:hypothetical protein